MKFKTKFEAIDFEKFGRETMLEVKDERMAGAICGQKLEALAHQLEALLTELRSARETLQQRSRALWSSLYDRTPPVRDSEMLTKKLRVWILLLSFVACFAATVACHAWTLELLGWSPLACYIAGVLLSSIVTLIMHQLFGHLDQWEKPVRLVFVAAACLLCLWSAIDWARARSLLLQHEAAQNTVAESDSYVDDPANEPSSVPSANTEATSEIKIKGASGDAIFKLAIAADLVVGILLSLLLGIYHDDDYSAWRELKKLARILLRNEKEQKELELKPLIAKEECLAGILRAKSVLDRRHPAYHRNLVALVVIMSLPFIPVHAQSVDRAEGILLDVSGSIGKSSNNDLFREYIRGMKQLLLTEPQKTRVWVSVINSDSFGGARPFVRGWTPEAKGVFTDDLNRARRELAKSFEAKAVTLRPVSSRTDIFGALWQMKILLDSVPARQKEIWIFSDMMNESEMLPMPSLLHEGPEAMFQRTKAEGLIIPLKGYRIHVLGASLAGLTPQAWSTTKAFWMIYFRQAEADLVEYSAECSSVDRRN